MRKKMVWLLIASVLLIVSLQVVYGTDSEGDPNIASASAQDSSEPPPSSDADIVVSWIPGPSSSFDIRVSILAFGSDIEYVSLSFAFCKSPAGDRLIIDGAPFSITPPPGGTVTVLTPTGATDSPEVLLRFTSFNAFEQTSFNLDPDTFGNSAYGATTNDCRNIMMQVWHADGRQVGAKIWTTYAPTGAVYAYVPYV